ncbi:substrate-binding domain-containing protein [Dactylosporangium sp. AC04546]|uniref:PstS family phosphate ABC transporter substrate-binding protein n=1 Tax=Dactylosporangium sp. AC04546 TaxID=2862460 RepID=UPI001EDDD0AC|nr:substrate-binding domain-containing protein [Dactylosporangium sp. AC04546]WVK85016.1 substrate-binding domain-containing protein [Dactylosporangium sp. AC04546]
MRTISKVGLGVAGVAVLLFAQATPASADAAAQGADIVGVGSDTIQYASDFLADGDYLGNPGFNAAGARMFSFDATGDARGTLTAGATVVLRAGTFPVVRPNGSGGGLTYFTQTDTGAVKKVQFVRSSRKPTKAEDDRAVANGWGGLRCYQLGLDGLKIATSKLVTSNAGTGGISTADLKKIYSSPPQITTWGQVTGYNGPNPGATIVPILPPATSGTEQFFIAQLGLTEAQVRTTAEGLVRAEEHDPAPVQSNANAIAPFSTARLVMIHNGYFNNGTAQDPINLLSGGSTFDVTRPVYFIVRNSEINTSWNKALFAPGGFLSQAFLAQPLIEDAAGFTYQYADAGLCHTA